MRKLSANDTVSANMGVAYMKRNGENKELFYAKSINAKVTKSKSKISTIGPGLQKHKSTIGEGTGTMVIYYMTPDFREALQDWKNSGIDMYFDLVLTNNDPGTSAGEQTVMLIDCNVDEVLLAQLDGSAEDVLEEEMPFTFDDFEILTPFKGI